MKNRLIKVANEICKVNKILCDCETDFYKGKSWGLNEALEIVLKELLEMEN